MTSTATSTEADDHLQSGHRHALGLWLILPSLLIAALGLAVGFWRSPSVVDESRIREAVTATLRDDLRSLNADVDSLQKRIAELSVQGSVEAEVPVGSIVAWPGNLPPNGDPWWNSWRVCDGGASDKERGLSLVIYKDHKKLWAVLRGFYKNSEAEALGDNGSIMLPDFRGVFLRGGGGASNPIGQRQEWATAMPRNPFTTAPNGGHSHDFQKSTNQTSSGGMGFALSGNPEERQPTSASGAHSHVILGGDEETRPTNFTVHWVIRIK